jgi:tetratricopeptide (TPR) repeat protein
MNKTSLTVLLLLLSLSRVFSLTADSGKSEDKIIYDLREVVFQQDLSDEEIKTFYLEQKEKLDMTEMDETDRLYYNSLLEYWMGRAYQSFDKTETAVEHHKMIQRGKFLKLQSYYTAKDEAILHYERALESINDYLDEQPDSEGYRQYSEVQGQLLLLKPVTYILAHGRSVKKTLKKSLELNPENVKSLIADGASDIYTPPRYGGDQEYGISLLKEALKMEEADREDVFNIYTGIAYGLIILERYREALDWLARAEGIYPGNIYLSGLQAVSWEGIRQ